jgi:hypothetical protein
MNLSKGPGYEDLRPGVAYTFIGLAGQEMAAGVEFVWLFPNGRAWAFRVTAAHPGGTYETVCIAEVDPNSLTPGPSGSPPTLPTPAAALVAA